MVSIGLVGSGWLLGNGVLVVLVPLFWDLGLCELSGARVTWLGSLMMVWFCVPRRALVSVPDVSGWFCGDVCKLKTDSLAKN